MNRGLRVSFFAFFLISAPATRAQNSSSRNRSNKPSPRKSLVPQQFKPSSAVAAVSHSNPAPAAELMQQKITEFFKHLIGREDADIQVIIEPFQTANMAISTDLKQLADGRSKANIKLFFSPQFLDLFKNDDEMAFVFLHEWGHQVQNRKMFDWWKKGQKQSDESIFKFLHEQSKKGQEFFSDGFALLRLAELKHSTQAPIDLFRRMEEFYKQPVKPTLSQLFKSSHPEFVERITAMQATRTFLDAKGTLDRRFDEAPPPSNRLLELKRIALDPAFVEQNTVPFLTKLEVLKTWDWTKRWQASPFGEIDADYQNTLVQLVNEMPKGEAYHRAHAAFQAAFDASQAAWAQAWGPNGEKFLALQKGHLYSELVQDKSELNSFLGLQKNGNLSAPMLWNEINDLKVSDPVFFGKLRSQLGPGDSLTPVLREVVRLRYQNFLRGSGAYPSVSSGAHSRWLNEVKAEVLAKLLIEHVNARGFDEAAAKVFEAYHGAVWDLSKTNYPKIEIRSERAESLQAVLEKVPPEVALDLQDGLKDFPWYHAILERVDFRKLPLKQLIYAGSFVPPDSLKARYAAALEEKLLARSRSVSKDPQKIKAFELIEYIGQIESALRKLSDLDQLDAARLDRILTSNHFAVEKAVEIQAQNATLPDEEHGPALAKKLALRPSTHDVLSGKLKLSDKERWAQLGHRAYNEIDYANGTKGVYTRMAAWLEEQVLNRPNDLWAKNLFTAYQKSTEQLINRVRQNLLAKLRDPKDGPDVAISKLEGGYEYYLKNSRERRKIRQLKIADEDALVMQAVLDHASEPEIWAELEKHRPEYLAYALSSNTNRYGLYDAHSPVLTEVFRQAWTDKIIGDDKKPYFNFLHDVFQKGAYPVAFTMRRSARFLTPENWRSLAAELKFSPSSFQAWNNLALFAPTELNQALRERFSQEALTLYRSEKITEAEFVSAMKDISAASPAKLSAERQASLDKEFEDEIRHRIRFPERYRAEFKNLSEARKANSRGASFDTGFLASSFSDPMFQSSLQDLYPKLSLEERIDRLKTFGNEMGFGLAQKRAAALSLSQELKKSLRPLDEQIALQKRLFTFLSYEDVHGPTGLWPHYKAILKAHAYNEKRARELIVALSGGNRSIELRLIDEVAKGHLLNLSAIESLKKLVLDRNYYEIGAAYKGIELMGPALREQLHKPVDALEYFYWLKEAKPTSPLPRIVESTLESVANSLKRNSYQEIPPNQIEKLKGDVLEFFQNGTPYERAALLKDVLRTTHKSGLLDSAAGIELLQKLATEGVEDSGRPFAQDFIASYMKSYGDELEGFALQLLVSKSQGGGEVLRQGQQIAATLEQKGALAVKLAQQLASDPHLIEDPVFRNDLIRLNDRAAEPTREDLYHMLQKELPPEEYAKIKHVREIRGSGSVNVVAAVEMEDGSQMIVRLIRDQPDISAANEKSRLDRTAAEMLRLADQRQGAHADQLRKLARALQSQAGAIAERLVQESNYLHEVAIADLIKDSYQQNYKDLGVSTRLAFSPEDRRGERWSFQKLIRGISPDSLTPQELLAVRHAAFRAELGAIHQSGRFDADGHMGNWLITRGDSGDLVLHRIDFSQGIAFASPAQLRAFNELIKGLGVELNPTLSWVSEAKKLSIDQAREHFFALVQGPAATITVEEKSVFARAWSQFLDNKESVADPYSALLLLKTEVSNQAGQTLVWQTPVESALKSLHSAQQNLDPLLLKNARLRNLSPQSVKEQEILHQVFGAPEGRAKLLVGLKQRIEPWQASWEHLKNRVRDRFQPDAPKAVPAAVAESSTLTDELLKPYAKQWSFSEGDLDYLLDLAERNHKFLPAVEKIFLDKELNVLRTTGGRNKYLIRFLRLSEKGFAKYLEKGELEHEVLLLLEKTELTPELEKAWLERHYRPSERALFSDQTLLRLENKMLEPGSYFRRHLGQATQEQFGNYFPRARALYLERRQAYKNYLLEQEKSPASEGLLKTLLHPPEFQDLDASVYIRAYLNHEPDTEMRQLYARVARAKAAERFLQLEDRARQGHWDFDQWEDMLRTANFAPDLPSPAGEEGLKYKALDQRLAHLISQKEVVVDATKYPYLNRIKESPKDVNTFVREASAPYSQPEETTKHVFDFEKFLRQEKDNTSIPSELKLSRPQILKAFQAKNQNIENEVFSTQLSFHPWLKDYFFEHKELATHVKKQLRKSGKNQKPIAPTFILEHWDEVQQSLSEWDYVLEHAKEIDFKPEHFKAGGYGRTLLESFNPVHGASLASFVVQLRSLKLDQNPEILAEIKGLALEWQKSKTHINQSRSKALELWADGRMKDLKLRSPAQVRTHSSLVERLKKVLDQAGLCPGR